MHYPAILAIEPVPAEFAYDEDFTILYALGLGAGAAVEDLPFVYEKGLRAIPTMAVMLGNAGSEIITRGGIDISRIVHGEQRLTLHRPLAPSGRVISRSRCIGAVDKGRDKGAIVNIESTIVDAASEELQATTVMTLFCRGDGGFGGPADGALPVHAVPVRPHDEEVAMPTLPQQAALYRLLGDKNPLHIDPVFAKAVGFERPILHGLCTYGIACRAILEACCDNDPSVIARFDMRCAAPVFPGDLITTRIWRDGPQISFECVVEERGATVIRNGLCQLRG